jgi:hypothetical protein
MPLSGIPATRDISVRARVGTRPRAWPMIHSMRSEQARARSTREQRGWYWYDWGKTQLPILEPVVGPWAVVMGP